MQYLQKSVIFIFVVWLLSGFVGVIAGINEKEFAKRELREPRELKEFSSYKNSKDFLFNAERFFDDRIFYRGAYISLYQVLGVGALTAAFKDNNSFFLGKDNWMYVGNYFGKVVDYTLNAHVPSEEEIQKTLSRLKEIQSIATSKNIPFVLLIPPNKQSIYSEFLPRWMKPRSDYRYADIIYDRAKEHGLLLTFPKKSILAEKIKASAEGKRLYWKDDTHWNKYGAFQAFKALWPILQTQGNFFDLPSIVSMKEVEKKVDGDLIKISKLSSEYRDLQDFDYEISHENKQRIVKGGHILTIDDSFSYSLMPLYELAFDKITRVHWGDITTEDFKDMVEQLKPDAIVYEVVEQKLQSGGILYKRDKQ